MLLDKKNAFLFASSKLSEIAPSDQKPFKINHKKSQLEIITPSGSSHLISYKIGVYEWTKISFTYPNGDRFDKTKNDHYSRNGIVFKTVEINENHRVVTHINDGVKLETFEIFDCFGNIRLVKSNSMEKRFIIDEGLVKGVMYPLLGVQFLSESSDRLTSSESVY